MVKRTIIYQRYCPWVLALGGGGIMYVMDTVIMRRAYCLRKMGIAAVLGLGVGAFTVDRVQPYKLHKYSTNAQEHFDGDIIHAFNAKHVNFATRVAGYGNSSLTSRYNMQNASPLHSKPY